MSVQSDAVFENLLIVRCQNGDDAAYAELISRYQTRLHYYLRQLVRDREAIDDLYQDVWFDVFQSLSKLKDAQAFPAWLFRIAHDRACRFLRRRGVVYQLDSSPDVTDASFDSPDQQWTAQDVYHAIDQIMPAHREILVLRYLQHFDYSEIADILGCP